MLATAAEDVRPTITLPALPECVSAVREYVRVILTIWQLPDLIDVALLLASELVTNAVRHAGLGRPFTVVILRTPDAVTVEVHDTEPCLPTFRDPGPDEIGGRGLVLVDALAADWKAEPTEGGKLVYFTLTAPTG